MRQPTRGQGGVAVRVAVAALLWWTCVLAPGVGALGAAAAEAVDAEVQAASGDGAPADEDGRAEPPLPPGLAEADGGMHPDPLARFNEPMFRFNRRLDDWVVRPVARGYAWLAPEPFRGAVDRFFDNLLVIPRVVNNVLQLRFRRAGIETARFGVNTTVGLLGFFDPAQGWLDLDPAPNDFGLTCRTYGLPAGPYLVLPFFGPFTVTDAVGFGVDWLMNPLPWLVPLYVSVAVGAGRYTVEAINYRSLHLDQFVEVDRFAIDLYGAVQDFYLQRRVRQLEELRAGP